MITQEIGSDQMIAQYPRYGVKKTATSTLHKSSSELDITGVIESPIPCMAFRKMHITAGMKYRIVFIRRYNDAVAMTFTCVVSVIRCTRTGATV